MHTVITTVVSIYWVALMVSDVLDPMADTFRSFVRAVAYATPLAVVWFM